MNKRGNVWLAVSGLVRTDDGRWLVVKKTYGGLKGKWSFPAGFVKEGETIDEAVRREIKEETGITTIIHGVLGIRSGVIKGKISDNMVIFLLKPEDERITIQKKELSQAAFLSRDAILQDEDTSVLVRHLLETMSNTIFQMNDAVNPGDHFGYTSYRVFLNENSN
ncbi:NUDIX hydrolase [Ectobacillus polymachus]|uniref:NUDIX hydrolase n=1 Tax=Ectobacillus polymachus TaxID=1508806 RepID=UPI003A83AAB0